MPSKLTNFLQEETDYQLKYQLYSLNMGFFTKKEKPFKGIRFDNYAYSRKKGVFLIYEWEIENSEEACINNIKKVHKILSYKWCPYLHMFHIFSPSCESYRRSCEKVADKLKNKYRFRFTYKPFTINISYDDFLKIENLFKRNQKQAKQRCGKRLRTHIGKIVRESIKMFTG